MNIQCPQCNRLIEFDSEESIQITFCPFCGARLNSQEAPKENSEMAQNVCMEEDNESLNSRAGASDTAESDFYAKRVEPEVARPAPSIPSAPQRMSLNSILSTASGAFSAGVGWLKTQKEKLEAYRKERQLQNQAVPPAENGVQDESSSIEPHYPLPTPPLPGEEISQEVTNPEQPLPTPPLPTNSSREYNYDKNQILPTPPLPGEGNSGRFSAAVQSFLQKSRVFSRKVFQFIRNLPFKRFFAALSACGVFICSGFARLKNVKGAQIHFRKIDYRQLILLLCGTTALVWGALVLKACKEPQIQIGCILLTISLILFFFRNVTSRRFSRFIGFLCILSTLLFGAALVWSKAVSPDMDHSWFVWNVLKTSFLFLLGLALFITTFGRSFWNLPELDAVTKTSKGKKKEPKKEPQKTPAPKIQSSRLLRRLAKEQGKEPQAAVAPVPAPLEREPSEKPAWKSRLGRPVTQFLVFLLWAELVWLGWGVYKTWDVRKISDHFAEKKIAPAQYCSALLYLDDQNSHYDFDRGMNYLESSAQQHFPYANEHLAQLLFEDGSRSSDVFENWEIAANAGLPNSMKSLALCYKNGWGTPRDEEKMLFWLNKASNSGQAEAQYHLAMAYWNGEGTEQNEKQALYWLTSSASRDCPEALCFLGKITLEGDGVPESPVQGAEYLVRADSLGNEEAHDLLKTFFCQNDGLVFCPELGMDWLINCSESEENDWAVERLNRYFAEEDGIKKSPLKAFNWLEKQAKIGNPEAAFLLAHILFDGIIVPKDETQGIQWLTKAAEEDILPAQKELAEDYYQGKYVTKDLAKAYAWYERAMYQEDLDAQYQVANCKYCGRGTPQKQAEGVTLWIDAARLGHEPSREKLNEIFIREDGLENLRTLGINWLKTEVDKNNEEARNRLNQFYLAEQDSQEALEFLEKSARNGDINAQFKIGKMYLYGNGTRQNVPDGFYWLQKVCGNTSPEGKTLKKQARNILDEFSFDSDNIEDFPEQTISWLENCANAGDTQALVLLGEFYLYGRNVDRNPQKGVDFLKKAVNDSQNSEAARILDEYFVDSVGLPEPAKEGIRWLIKKAEAGDEVAQLKLANCYLEGTEVPRNPSKAIPFLEMASDQGNPEASLKLGECYRDGLGTAKNLQKAFAYFEKSASGGNVTAQCYAARCCKEGIGTEKNPEKAASYWKAASENGDTVALYEYGKCCQTGNGTSVDLFKAADCFAKAASKGHTEAQLEYGKCCLAGKGTAKNLSRGVGYIEEAAEDGNLEALAILGECYIQGAGILEDRSTGLQKLFIAKESGWEPAEEKLEAFLLNGNGRMADLQSSRVRTWLQKKAEEGDPDACLLVGKGLMDGIGFEKNSSRAFDLLNKASDAGNEEAETILVKLVLKDKNGEKLSKSVLDWLHKEAEKGNPDACLKLGECYRDGFGVAMDLQKAFGYFEKSASGGNVTAQCNAAICCKEGIGTEKNPGKAASYWKVASENGDTTALYEYGKCCQSGSGTPVSLSKAADCFSKAASKGHVEAKLEYGKCCLTGNGTSRNPAKGVRNIEEAADAGNLEALGILGECCVLGNGTIENRSAGLQKLIAAKERGWEPAEEKLKTFLLKGNGKMSDLQISKVRIWLQKKANEGDPDACLLVGKGLMDGIGFEVNTAQAIAMLNKASNAGNEEAGKILVKKVIKERGEEKLPQSVQDWLQRESEKGNADAMVYLGVCKLLGVGGFSGNQDQAFELFQKAAALGNADGQYWLGRCWWEGFGTEKSPSEGYKWFERAAKQNHPQAMEEVKKNKPKEVPELD